MSWLACCLLCLPLPACKSETVAAVAIEEVFNGDHCGLPQPTVALISDATQWRGITRAAERFIDENASAAAEQRFNTLSQTAYLVLLAVGSKPSPGFGIRVDGKGARLVHRQLIVEVAPFAPPADSLQAAVMTSPCVVIAVARDERVEQLRVNGLDQSYTLDVSATIR